MAAKIPHRWLIRIASLQYRFPILKPALQAVSRRFRNQDAVMQGGIGRGLKFNTGGSIAGYAVGISEPDMQAALSLLTREGMVVYDIGANVGFFSVLMARLVGASGQVFSFEPVPKNARQIQYNARLNGFRNIHVEMAAIGETDGTATFRVTDFSTTGKLASVGTVGLQQTEEISVALRQLDALVGKSEIPAPGLMKIDAEGAEVAILGGASHLLETARPLLVIELHNTANEVMSILSRHDYVAHVLGSRKTPQESNWNCRIVAVPREANDFAALIPRLTDARLMS